MDNRAYAVPTDNFFNRESNGKFKSGNVVGVSFGRPLKWETPESLLESVNDYLAYCENNPILVDGVYGKDPTNATYERPRITTIMGFCAFCKTIPQTFYDYEKKTGYSEVISFARNMFTANNLEQASAGTANMNIVSRIEGLVDKKEVRTEQIQTVFFEVPQIEQPIQHKIEAEDAEWNDL